LGDVSKSLAVNIPRKAWTHLGLAVSIDGKTTSVYLNGMMLGRIVTGKPFFRIAKGANGALPQLTLGRVGTNANRLGFRGWIDDFKLFAYIPTLEVICNHAYGSLHWLTPQAQERWRQVAALYPSNTHSTILNEIPSSYSKNQMIPTNAQFVCTADYSDAMGIYRSRGRENEGLHSIRDAVLFRVPTNGGAEDGQLRWNQTRANFMNNSFCLSCHTQESSRGFSLAALSPGNICEAKDPRRQPQQAPRYLAGQVTGILLQSIDSEASSRPMMRDPESGALYFDPLIIGEPSDELSCR
jgi:hypothetical protein